MDDEEGTPRGERHRLQSRAYLLARSLEGDGWKPTRNTNYNASRTMPLNLLDALFRSLNSIKSGNEVCRRVPAFPRQPRFRIVRIYHSLFLYLSSRLPLPASYDSRTYFARLPSAFQFAFCPEHNWIRCAAILHYRENRLNSSNSLFSFRFGGRMFLRACISCSRERSFAKTVSRDVDRQVSRNFIYFYFVTFIFQIAFFAQTNF